MNTLQESDQVVQRRANLEELKKLGVDPYPHRFEAGTTIDAIVAEHGNRSAEELEALTHRSPGEGGQAHVRTAGRILAIRNFGKANFLVISDGRARVNSCSIQPGSRISKACAPRISRREPT